MKNTWLQRLIINYAWPQYECQSCVGFFPEYPGACYCAHNGAFGPCNDWYSEARVWARAWTYWALAYGIIEREPVIHSDLKVVPLEAKPAYWPSYLGLAMFSIVLWSVR